jgi:hypothetical protein
MAMDRPCLANSVTLFACMRQGANDPRVKKAESDQMVQAMHSVGTKASDMCVFVHMFIYIYGPSTPSVQGCALVYSSTGMYVRLAPPWSRTHK